MLKTLEELVSSKSKGLFLLDPPTGFGKTTVVVDLIKKFLNKDVIFKGVKRLFFFTNLKNNLPFDEVLKDLNDEQRKQCLQIKANDESVIENLLHIDENIVLNEIKYSKEYKNLKAEVETYQGLKNSLDNENDETNRERIRNSLKIFKKKIPTDTEPTFRKFIKSNYFYNKSICEKRDFLKRNPWLAILYPVINLNKYSVVFLTSKRFVLPIDTFQRLPFYLYNDDFVENSIVFIDEFDSAKQVFLDQIVEDGLKNKIDTVQLFLNLHFALHNLTIPKELLNTTAYHKEKEMPDEEGNRWYTTSELFDYWRSVFAKVYEENELQYLLKSVDFEYKRAFLFDDGQYFHIVNDSSTKYLYVHVDNEKDILAIKGCPFDYNKTHVNKLLRNIENSIDIFAQGVFYAANNYLYYKNSNKRPEDIEYSKEESIYTVLDVFNLSEVEKQYLFTKIQTFDFAFRKPQKDEKMRRGFNFTEIEDSNYHDIKSVIHKYNFHSTPEDVLLKLSSKALVVGVSATSKVQTCIGNFDMSYVCKQLGSNYFEISESDQKRIANQFEEMIDETKGKYQIHINLIDDLPVFSDKEKCQILISELYKGQYIQKFLNVLEEGDINTYYYLIELKLAKIYLDMKTKQFKSFIAYLNCFPKHDKKRFSLDRLMLLFDAINDLYKGQQIRVEVVESANYDYQFKSIYEDLSNGKAVFVITTYQTIGSGKNIQYTIPESEVDNVVFCSNDTRKTKDFDAIYLLTPTNLLQNLSYDGESKYNDLAKYLFQQEYLYKNGYLSYGEMKHNITCGFKKVFFSDKFSFYPKNGDLYNYTLRLIIQAVGRICRCRNKNKNIYIYTDKEVVERVQRACTLNCPKLLNEEFKYILNYDLQTTRFVEKISEYSRQSKKAYWDIKKAAHNVRRSREAILEWQELRDYVLRNPTTPEVPEKYKVYYFDLQDKYSGYSYRYGKNYDIVEMKMEMRYSDMHQVSEQAADLPLILSSNKYLIELFNKNKYAKEFKPNRFVMSPSLFKQVYLGALGEVVGREIIEREVALDLEELLDVDFYEFFDFKINDCYFDFKHWNEFYTDAEEYAKKIKLKLNKIKGAKCFVINLIKRNDAKIMNSVDDTIIQIPYLIDAEKSMINMEAIEFIQACVLNNVM